MNNIIRIAWQGVWGFKLRTLLAIVALTATVVGVVSVTAASSTVQSTVLQRAILQNGREATIDISGLRGAAGLKASELLAKQLQSSLGPDGQIARVATLESVLFIGDDSITSIPVDFADPNLINIRLFPLLHGQWIGESNGIPLVMEVALNASGAVELQSQVGATLDMLSLGSQSSNPVRIVAVVEDGYSTPHAYIDIGGAGEFLSENSSHLSINIKASQSGLVANEVQSMLGTWSQRSLNETVFEVRRQDTVENLRSEVEATRTSFLTVGLIGLLASICAIANIGLSTLRERASELSLRRALGARRWHIPAIMIAESQIVAFIAAGIAIPMSWVIYPAMVSRFGAPFGVLLPPYPWEYAAVGLLVGMGTALLGSLAPAAFALNVRIANVMRE